MLSGRREYVERVNRVLDYIDRHLADPLPLEQLARVGAFSPFHFHRIFAALMGERLGDYIRRRRLETAAMSLSMRPQASVTEIAFECGFTSPAAFARAFKERFGLPATEWREREIAKSKIGKADRNLGKAPSIHPSYPGIADFEAGAQEREMDIEIREIPAFTIAYVRHVGPYGPGVGQAYGRLFQWAGPRGLMGPAMRLLGVSHDSPDVTDPAKCRYDAALEVPTGTAADGDIGIAEIPAGAYGVLRFRGPQEGISQAYQSLYRIWLPDSGYEPADRPPLEFQLKNPDAEPKGVFEMEICIPIRPA